MLEFVDVPAAGSERDTLTATLHNLRVVVEWKLDGLDEEQARRPMVPSGTSLLGLVQHLAGVELYWFVEHVAAGDADLPDDLRRWWNAVKEAWQAGDDDTEWRIDDADTTSSVLNRYEAAIEVSDRIIATHELDHRPALDRARSLRWVLVHMIDETGRHAGHADILREQIDGTTGYLPS